LGVEKRERRMIVHKEETNKLGWERWIKLKCYTETSMKMCPGGGGEKGVLGGRLNFRKYFNLRKQRGRRRWGEIIRVWNNKFSKQQPPLTIATLVAGTWF
jgi:hypothetical protein